MELALFQHVLEINGRKKMARLSWPGVLKGFFVPLRRKGEHAGVL